MSVTSVITLSAGLSGRATGTEPADVVRSFRVRYRAECDSLSDDPYTVLEYFRNTSTLPYMGRPYGVGNGADADAICKELDAERVDKSQYFTVTAAFEPRSGGGEQNAGVIGLDENGKETKDPTKFRDEIEVSWYPISEAVEMATFRGFDPADLPNNFIEPGTVSPIMNAAMQPLEGVERENHVKVIRISKFRGSYDSALFTEFENETVNSDIVTILKMPYRFRETFGPFRGKLVPVPATLGFLNDILYYRHTLEVHIHPRGWRKVLANIGTEEKFADGDFLNGEQLFVQNGDFEEGTDHFKKAITDEDGIPITSPVPLDGFGHAILSKTSPRNWLVWSVYPEAPFAGIEW